MSGLLAQLVAKGNASHGIGYTVLLVAFVAWGGLVWSLWHGNKQNKDDEE